jgi:hypothetical protein
LLDLLSSNSEISVARSPKYLFSKAINQSIRDEPWKISEVLSDLKLTTDKIGYVAFRGCLLYNSLLPPKNTYPRTVEAGGERENNPRTVEVRGDEQEHEITPEDVLRLDVPKQRETDFK